jgi:hypothetical protein
VGRVGAGVGVDVDLLTLWHDGPRHIVFLLIFAVLCLLSGISLFGRGWLPLLRPLFLPDCFFLCLLLLVRWRIYCFTVLLIPWLCLRIHGTAFRICLTQLRSTAVLRGGTVTAPSRAYRAMITPPTGTLPGI